ncbi:MAG: hypothetical protein ACT4OX_11595 [Actinomycetota bacterium]
MLQCDNCGYLVPADWEECKRCHAAVTAGVLAPVTATPSAPAATPSAAPAAPWLRPPGPSAPSAAPPPPSRPSPSAPPEIATPGGHVAPSGFDPRYAAPARIGLPGAPGGPTPSGLGAASPYERVPTASSQWSTPVTPVKRSSGSLKKLLCVGLLCLGAFVGWEYVGAWRNAVPAEVEEYVDGGGVEYAPAGMGYSVRLPETPTETSDTQSAYGMSVTINAAIIERDQWEAGVAVTDLPVVVPDDQAEAVMREAIAGGTSAMAGEFESAEVTTHSGLPAMDATLDGPDGHPVRVLVVMSGSRLYILMAHAVQGTEKIFDELVESFSIGLAV